MKQLLALLAFATFAQFAAAQTAAPTLIPFQGRLTDQNGVAYTNNQYTIVFQLYDQAVGGSLLWSERHEKVGVLNGMVNVFLGSISSLGAVNFSTTRYLGITVDGDNNPNTPDPEMVPRQMIIPAFWAKNADNATKLGGYGWDAILAGGATNPLTGLIAGAKLSPGSISTVQLANGAVSGANIATGAVSSAQIAVDGVGTSNLAQSSVTWRALRQRAISSNIGLGDIAVSGVQSQLIVKQGDPETELQAIRLDVVCSGRPLVVVISSGGSGTGSFYAERQHNALEASALLKRDGIGIGGINMYAQAQAVVWEHGSAIPGQTGGSGVKLEIPANWTFFDATPPAGTRRYTFHIQAPWNEKSGIIAKNIRMVIFEL